MSDADGQTIFLTKNSASLDEIQHGWHDLKLRVGQLEAEKTVLEEQNKALRFLLERTIEHRQKSHNELVLVLAGLVSKLPINNVSPIVARLMEHNTAVNEMCAALVKGKPETVTFQPTVLKELDQTKRDLIAALKPAVEELIKLDTPLESDVLKALVTDPESFFSPKVVRSTRGFLKGQVPRERIVREFGEEALVFFNDLTTDPKLNPKPKPEEIMLGFKNEFEDLFKQNPSLVGSKREDLQKLYDRVQRSKAPGQTRVQKNVFLRISFILELLHYYENQNVEAPDVVFAQRLPAFIEQLVIANPQDGLDEKMIVQAETLLAFVIHPEHRMTIINNIGKGGGSTKTLKLVLKLRVEKLSDFEEVLPDFAKHIMSVQKPTAESLTAIVRMIHADYRRMVTRAIMDSDKVRKDEAETLGKIVAKELGLSGLDAPAKAAGTSNIEEERQLAWDGIKDLITSRSDPTTIAAAVRDRLHARYDADEVKQSWVTLTEADPISLIRVFCQLPYLPDGKTDPVARAVMETYVTRLMHPKYAPIYNKIANSLKNMFKANPNSPTLVNFMALVRWVDGDAANKLTADVGMLQPAH
jgi:hypothetical protein